MGKNVAVEGMQLTFSGVLNPVWTVATPPSDKVTASNKGVYFGNITVNLTGGQLGIWAFVSATPFMLTPTATKCKNQQGMVLLEGDQASGSVTWATGSPSMPFVTQPCTCVVQSAGQTKVQAT